MFIQVSQLSKLYSTDWVFRHISFDLQQGERIALVGPNGCGKTTLLKCLSKQESWEEGDIYIRKNLAIGYLQQIPVYEEAVTVQQVLDEAFAEVKHLELRMKALEQLMAGMGAGKANVTSQEPEPKPEPEQFELILEEYGQVQKEFELRGGYELEAKIDKVCQGLEISSSMRKTEFKRLSGGEKTKISLARVLLQEPELILLDEPTNHLDLEAIEWLEEFLRAYKGTVLVVSHDRYFLNQVVNKVFDLENGELSTYLGNYNDFIRQKEERLLAEFQAFQEQQKKIKKMQETIKRLRQWANEANPPNAGLHRRASSMQKALERMEKIKRPLLERRKIGLSFELEQRSGQDVVSLEDIAMCFGNQELFRNVQLQVRFQEKVAIIGRNGTGKSTLFKLLLGQFPPTEGQVKLGSNVKLGYLSQQGIEGYEHETVLEAYRDQAHVEEGEARQLLARFLFYGASVFRKVKDLSGGEKMRLRLAQLMAQDINLLLLDEPTNHLDIDSREVLEDALAEFSGTIVSISHDRYFLNKLFTQIYWLEQQTLTKYLGSYDEAKEQRQLRSMRILSSNTSNDKVKKGSSSKGKLPNVSHSLREKEHQQHTGNEGTPIHRKNNTASGNQVRELEQQIEKLEQRLAQLSAWLYHPENQEKWEQLQEWTAEKEELEQKRDALLEQWLEHE